MLGGFSFPFKSRSTGSSSESRETSTQKDPFVDVLEKFDAFPVDSALSQLLYPSETPDDTNERKAFDDLHSAIRFYLYSKVAKSWKVKQYRVALASAINTRIKEEAEKLSQLVAEDFNRRRVLPFTLCNYLNKTAFILWKYFDKERGSDVVNLNAIEIFQQGVIQLIISIMRDDGPIAMHSSIVSNISRQLRELKDNVVELNSIVADLIFHIVAVYKCQTLFCLDAIYEQSVISDYAVKEGYVKLLHQCPRVPISDYLPAVLSGLRVGIESVLTAIINFVENRDDFFRFIQETYSGIHPNRYKTQAQAIMRVIYMYIATNYPDINLDTDEGREQLQDLIRVSIAEIDKAQEKRFRLLSIFCVSCFVGYFLNNRDRVIFDVFKNALEINVLRFYVGGRKPIYEFILNDFKEKTEKRRFYYLLYLIVITFFPRNVGRDFSVQFERIATIDSRRRFMGYSRKDDLYSSSIAALLDIDRVNMLQEFWIDVKGFADRFLLSDLYTNISSDGNRLPLSREARTRVPDLIKQVQIYYEVYGNTGLVEDILSSLRLMHELSMGDGFDIYTYFNIVLVLTSQTSGNESLCLLRDTLQGLVMRKCRGRSVCDILYDKFLRTGNAKALQKFMLYASICFDAKFFEVEDFYGQERSGCEVLLQELERRDLEPASKIAVDALLLTILRERLSKRTHVCLYNDGSITARKSSIRYLPARKADGVWKHDFGDDYSIESMCMDRDRVHVVLAPVRGDGNVVVFIKDFKQKRSGYVATHIRSNILRGAIVRDNRLYAKCGANVYSLNFLTGKGVIWFYGNGYFFMQGLAFDAGVTFAKPDISEPFALPVFEGDDGFSDSYSAPSSSYSDDERSSSGEIRSIGSDEIIGRSGYLKALQAAETNQLCLTGDKLLFVRLYDGKGVAYKIDVKNGAWLDNYEDVDEGVFAVDLQSVAVSERYLVGMHAEKLTIWKMNPHYKPSKPECIERERYKNKHGGETVVKVMQFDDYIIRDNFIGELPSNYKIIKLWENYLIGVGYDNVVVIYDLDSMKELRRIDGGSKFLALTDGYLVLRVQRDGGWCIKKYRIRASRD